MTTSLQVLFCLPLGLGPSTSYPMHFFTQSSSSYAAHAHTNAACSAVIPMLCHLYLVSLSAPYFIMVGTTTTTIQRPFVRDNPGRPVPEETFTRSHPSWSTYFLYHLSPFSTVHGILFIQLTCLTVLSNNLFPGPLWSSPWS